MVGEEFCGNANVLSKVEWGPCRLCFSFHGVDVDKVLTPLVCLELCVLTQRLDIDWHGVGAEEGTETLMSHGQGGLGNPDAPLLSK